MAHSTPSRTLLFAAVAITIGGALMAAPARATVPTLDVRDATHDVHITPHTYPGVPVNKDQRRSIDIKRVTVTPRSNDTVRIKVEIRQVLGTKRFDQMVFVELTPVSTSTGDWISADIWWSNGAAPKELATASAEYQNSFRNCVVKLVQADKLADTMTADVPKRCIPAGDAKVAVRTFTGFFRTDADVLSRDKLVVRGALR